MINGVHAIIYTPQAEAAREFLRDVLGLPSVDTGGGWLIFGLPPSELAIHPTDGASSHELFLLCDDVEATVAALRAKGVDVDGQISEHDWGRSTTVHLPGDVRIGLYQPKHPRPEPAPGS